MTSKAEYLKRYLSGGDAAGKKKKKKKRHKKPPPDPKTVIIVDDDPDWKKSAQSSEEDESDTPIIVEYRDDQKEMEMRARWRPLVKSELKKESPPHSPPPDAHIPPSPGATNRATHHLTPPHPSDNNNSPTRERRRHDSDLDDGHDEETTQKSGAARHDTDSDTSPVRQAGVDSAVGNHSPPGRRRGSNSDASPPRRGSGGGGDKEDSDVSPERRQQRRQAQRGSDSDASPPRKRGRREERQLVAGRIRRPMGVSQQSGRDRPRSDHRRSDDPGASQKMTAGGRVGLQNAKTLRVENDAMRSRRDRELKEMDTSVSGKGAETVHRDKHGRKIDPKLEKELTQEQKKQKAEQDQEFYEWGRGVAQTRMAHDKVADDLHEMSKPLARYKDDEDLENLLRAREREDDPMLEYIKKKKMKKNFVIDSRGIKKPKKERPIYKGNYPPNRFTVRPGYRWDGIDRSNGYEQSRFAREANKIATAELAYKWSVEDM